MRTKLSAKYVIAFDGARHILLRDGQVVFEGNSIVFVGRDYPGSCDEELDCGNAIISPGFVDLDALGDIDHGLIHCEAPKEIENHLIWSRAYYEKGSREILSAEEEAFKSLYAYVQLIRHGVTTAMPITSVYYKRWAETYEEIEAAAHHAGRLGLRVYLGPSYQSGMRVVNPDGTWEVLFNEDEGRRGLERAVRFVEEFDGAYDGRVCGVLVPERIECQTEENLLVTRAAADRLGCRVRLHAAQGSFEYGWIRNRHGLTPIQYLDRLGFLGRTTLIPHVLYTQGYSEIHDDPVGDDVALLARTGTTVIHCPLVYARSGAALESFGRYRRAGVNMAMGTDTFPPDMLAAIRIGSIMARCVDRAREGNTYADFFEAATLGGARALGRDDLGRIAAGARADMIVLDLDGLDVGTIDDPLRTIVNSGTSREVRHSIIDGRFVMRDRVIEGVDEAELRDRAQAYYEKMRMGYWERSDGSLTPEQLFPGSFPEK
ncbi:MAG: amidohydrolase family protein [Fretibacterium sp.]|nr:amidohydrolase family protein [Fretibacterium sp.]